MTQLVFDLPAPPRMGREDFMASPANAEALAWIERWPDWPLPGLVLAGPHGCGKTHLAHVFAGKSDAVLLSAASLDEGRVPSLDGRNVVVEDCQAPLPERALFHLLNQAREAGRFVLLTAQEPQARWGVGLADLRSRLLALPLAEMKPPDDALLTALLVKLFADRQLKVGADALAFVPGRIERSFAAVLDLVAAADRKALAEKRPVTIPLIKELLESTDV